MAALIGLSCQKPPADVAEVYEPRPEAVFILRQTFQDRKEKAEKTQPVSLIPPRGLEASCCHTTAFIVTLT